MVGNRKILLATGAAALLGGLTTVAATAGEVANYSPVTQQRLLNPEPGNWLLYRHD